MTTEERMIAALLAIGPKCETYTRGTCYEDKTMDAPYTADRWCNGCIAAWGLAVNPDRMGVPYSEIGEGEK
jgi:hypothetical protein